VETIGIDEDNVMSIKIQVSVNTRKVRGKVKGAKVKKRRKR
jgi:hypothetical protein